MRRAEKGKKQGILLVFKNRPNNKDDKINANTKNNSCKASSKHIKPLSSA
jgi:hypothetical protein